MCAAGDEYDVDELRERRICAGCVGEKYLKNIILTEGQDATCDYCAASAKTFSIGELADYIDGAFEAHYTRTPEEPSGYEYALAKESDDGWERHGDPVEWAIANAAEIDDVPAQDVQRILADSYDDRHAEKVGEETEFSDGSYYELKGVDDYEFRSDWRFFEDCVKGDIRHFNSEAESILENIFGDFNQHRTRDERSSVVTVGPDQEIKSFFRARVFQSSSELLNALKYPDQEIGPPPMHAALPGRMNARGVSMFYGATGIKTAIAEVRPPVGSRVVVGRFDLLRPVQLLDVRALKDIYAEGSVFDRSYLEQLGRAKFLERLSERISKAVMPNDETLDYIVTQVIADYLATRDNPSLDGILFSSPQQPNDGLNVVLFHKASRVKIDELPPGTTVNASDSFFNGDEYEFCYCVDEDIPSSSDEKKASITTDFQNHFQDDLVNDIREPTLKLNTGDVYVHHVDEITYATSPYMVTRVRRQK